MSKFFNAMGDFAYRVTAEVEKLAAAIVVIAFGYLAAIAITGGVVVLFPAVAFFFLLGMIPVGAALAYTKIKQ